MILYKYYGFNAGIAALESSRLGFRNPAYFNDPFELSFLDNTEGNTKIRTEWEVQINRLREAILVLSLTRTPLNPLMWAHYGENHTGFVIGYEVDTLFLNDENNCLVPVDQGDVVYTSTKPLYKLTPVKSLQVHSMWLGILTGENSHSSENRTKLQSLTRNLFLTKHSSWVYEEEVRIIKATDSILEMMKSNYTSPMRKNSRITRTNSEGIEIETVPGLRIFDHKVNVREVYLGIRNPLLDIENKEDLNINKEMLYAKSKNENWSINTINMSKGTWDLMVNPATSEIFGTNPST